MKYSITSYSLSQLLRSGLTTQFSMIALAKTLGFDGIEFTDLIVPEGMTEEAYALALKAEAARCGMDIVSHTVGANLLADDQPAEIARLKHKVDIAALLGAPTMRHDAYFGFPANDPEPSFEKYLDKVADGFREVAAYAQTKGVKLCTENHGFICQAPERVEAIIKKVNHPNFGWLVDMGNFLCADADPIHAVTVAAPYAFHVHAKDFVKLPSPEGCIKTPGGNFIQGTIVGQGIVPVKECVNILRKAGYDGYMTVEFEGPQPALSAVAQGLAFLKSC